MSEATARKIVVATLVVGMAAIVYQAQKAGTPTSQTYKRVWGLTILTAGGAVLADFAPAVVGPYMALVLIVFLVNTKGGLGSLFQSAGTAAGTSTGG